MPDGGLHRSEHHAAHGPAGPVFKRETHMVAADDVAMSQAQSLKRKARLAIAGAEGRGLLQRLPELETHPSRIEHRIDPMKSRLMGLKPLRLKLGLKKRAKRVELIDGDGEPRGHGVPAPGD